MRSLRLFARYFVLPPILTTVRGRFAPTVTRELLFFLSFRVVETVRLANRVHQLCVYFCSCRFPI